MTTFQVAYPEIGRCMCGAVLRVDSFRTVSAYESFYRTGLCQSCFDASSFGASQSDPSHRFPVRRGAMVSASCEGESGLELVIFPFLFVVPEPRIAWEARSILRIGPRLEPLDQFDELLPMKDLLTGHQIRVHEATSLADATEAAAQLSRLELMIAPDRETFPLVDRAGDFPDAAVRVALAEAIPWRRAYGQPLLPFGRWWPFPTEEVSVLRACALLGMAFGLAGRGECGRPPLHELLLSLGDSFGEGVPIPRPHPDQAR